MADQKEPKLWAVRRSDGYTIVFEKDVREKVDYVQGGHPVTDPKAQRYKLWVVDLLEIDPKVLTAKNLLGDLAEVRAAIVEAQKKKAAEESKARDKKAAEKKRLDELKAKKAKEKKDADTAKAAGGKK